MTKIIKSITNWIDVKNVSRTTVNKNHTEKEVTKDFKRKILISEHSPIRELIFRWKWENIKSWIATHFSRHKWECYISTQRTDRTGINRDETPQGALVNMDCSANAQQLIDTSRKRLCYCSSSETRKKWEDLKRKINILEPEISNVMVPNCLYRMGCPETFSSCTFFKLFIKDKSLEDLLDIQKRYDAYNKEFYNE